MQKVEGCRFIAKLVKETMKNIINKAFPTINEEVLIQNGPKYECEYVTPSAMK